MRTNSVGQSRELHTLSATIYVRGTKLAKESPERGLAKPQGSHRRFESGPLTPTTPHYTKEQHLTIKDFLLVGTTFLLTCAAPTLAGVYLLTTWFLT